MHTSIYINTYVSLLQYEHCANACVGVMQIAHILYQRTRTRGIQVSLCITFARNSMLQTYQNKWLLQTSADTFLGLHLQISLRFCNISENGEHVYFCRELLYLCINVQYSMLMVICLSVLINEENCFRTCAMVCWQFLFLIFYF